MVIALEPATCQVPAAGGTSTHQILNQAGARLAFKVKSSNNAQYRIKPVFGFIEDGGKTAIDIVRQAGPRRRTSWSFSSRRFLRRKTIPERLFSPEPCKEKSL
ncbi:hypothetical protein L596_018386 [Steinernema carpocapsae]|uniref:MSP domain-containing protein n=1 Tax=Steinernema carpocapsae TaxID=34508 RepID=A0A4U5N4Y5_STECR|nr:hypothetical protein L596_018386 [Steinernema carpocapsae]